MEKRFEKYFLGANSCEGFVSEFGSSFRANEGWRAYLIKGGPGTGKSSFMKHLAEHARKAGVHTVLCPCSSDPASLDGVIFPERRTVVLDATAPHVVEPQFPGACEEIVNLGAFWNGARLRADAAAVIADTARNKTLHRRAGRYLQAAGLALGDNLQIARGFTDETRCAVFAERLCRRNIPVKKDSTGSEWVRFIQGVTPLGVIAYTGTVENFYDKKIILSDPFGGVSPIFMEAVRNYAVAAGYEVITLRSALLPGQMIDHVLIPELSLAFVTENDYIHFTGDERRIHVRRFSDVTRMHASRQKLLFNKRLARELLNGACATLKEAKASHDRLERHYIAAMDFQALTGFAEQFAASLF